MKQPDCQSLPSGNISELPTSEVNSALQLKFQSYQLKRSTVPSGKISELPTTEAYSALQVKFQSYQLKRSTEPSGKISELPTADDNKEHQYCSLFKTK